MTEKKLVISHPRVCNLLREHAGWTQGKTHDRQFFLDNHAHIPGLVHEDNPDKSTKEGIAHWYWYDTKNDLTVDEAEWELAVEFSKFLGLSMPATR